MTKEERILNEVAEVVSSTRNNPVIDLTDPTKDQDVALAEQFCEKLPFEFITAILIKPLNTVTIQRPALKPLVDPTMHDKFYGGKDNKQTKGNKTKQEMETVPANVQAGIVLKLPLKLPEHLTELKVGDIIILPTNAIQQFDLYAGSALVSPATLLGFYTDTAGAYNTTLGADGKPKPKAKV